MRERTTKKQTELLLGSAASGESVNKSTPIHWAVRVECDGDNILSIESNMLAGKADFTAEDEDCIRYCAQQLLAFIGPALPSPRLAPSGSTGPADAPKHCSACGRTDIWAYCDERTCPVRQKPVAGPADAGSHEIEATSPARSLCSGRCSLHCPPSTSKPRCPVVRSPKGGDPVQRCERDDYHEGDHVAGQMRWTAGENKQQ